MLIKWGQSQDKRLSILIDKESVAPILYHPEFTEDFPLKPQRPKLVWGRVNSQLRNRRQTDLQTCLVVEQVRTGEERRNNATEQKAPAVI